ncbi:hypothetical protein E2C01_081366 [Portunus trituberculatus]|uniref:Uncharacterized protein n=1 Tax=Portunus trituberculatus TaxID=210409 RepID=A0A5B7IVM5_PORTR|nr:hypothetical protein [Portunus trituberculatus]
MWPSAVATLPPWRRHPRCARKQVSLKIR